MDAERRKGDTIQFHWIVKSMFNSIQELFSQPKNKKKNQLSSDRVMASSTNTTTPTTTKVNKQPGSCTSTLQDETSTITTTTAMDNICTLLRKDRLDAKLLGMESLDLLTRSSSNFSDIAFTKDDIVYQASKAVVCFQQEDAEEEDDHNDHSPWQQTIQDEIMELILCHPDNLDEAEDNNNNMKKNTYELCSGSISSSSSSCAPSRIVNTDTNTTTQLEDKIKQLAFKVYANSLMNVMRRSDDLRNTFHKHTEEWKNILVRLVEQMKASTNNPFQSFQIARCIHCLLMLDDQMNNFARELDVVNIMIQHQGDISVCRYRALEEASKSIVSHLSQSKE